MVSAVLESQQPTRKSAVVLASSLGNQSGYCLGLATLCWPLARILHPSPDEPKSRDPQARMHSFVADLPDSHVLTFGYEGSANLSATLRYT